MIGPGTQVGSYRILSQLGEGGMGMVFVAEHVALERKVALKVLRPEMSADPETVSRFFNEAKAVNKVGHEHIVDVTDFGQAPSGESYYVMELLPGLSLAQRLRAENRLGVARTLNIAIQVADALSASHAVGIVHRDLKPDNVLLIHRGGDPDYVKLLDFGIAKLVGIGSKVKTRSGAVIGTPYYMSPEQGMGRSDVDHRSDVYSLAIMMFEMLVGRVPFNAEGWGEVLLMHATRPFPALTAENPEIPLELDRIVRRAAEKERDARYPNMAAMRDELLALLMDGQEVTPRPVSSRLSPTGSKPRIPVAAPMGVSTPGRQISAAAFEPTMTPVSPVAAPSVPPTAMPELQVAATLAPLPHPVAPSLPAGQLMPTGSGQAPPRGRGLLWAGLGIALVGSVALVSVLVRGPASGVAAGPPPEAPPAAERPAAAAAPPPATPVAAPTPDAAAVAPDPVVVPPTPPPVEAPVPVVSPPVTPARRPKAGGSRGVRKPAAGAKVKPAAKGQPAGAPARARTGPHKDDVLDPE